MKNNPRISSKKFSSIQKFLSEHDWTIVNRNAAASFYAPPRDLGIDEKFTIAIPVVDSVSKSSNLLYTTVNVLEQIYERKFPEFYLDNEEVGDAKPSWVLKSKLKGDSVGLGTISLSKIDIYLSQITKSFHEAAKFKLGGDSAIQVAQASKFVDSCQFLPTGSGSFITSIEIPFEEIRQSDLVSPSLTSQEVITNWFSAIDFLNTSVLKGNVDELKSDVVLGDAIRLLNIPLADSLKKLIDGAALSRFDLELDTPNGLLSSSTGSLDRDSLGRLSDFVKYFRDSLTVESNITFAGKIFELRSKNPDGNQNHVMIKGLLHGDYITMSMTLNYDNYQTAIQAHKLGRTVKVVGEGVRLKTQTRITRIDEFTIA